MRGGLLLATAFAVQGAQAEPAWKAEFQDVCSKTQDSMALPLEELRSLVARCDKLKPLLDALEESERKVYSRRLRACCDLYAFVIKAREEEK